MADDVDEQVVMLYRRWSGALIGYAGSWTGGNVGEAEELVDEAFHQLYRQWDRIAGFNDKGRYGWLRTVTRNLAVTAYRRRRGTTVPVDPIEEAERLDRACAIDDPDDPVHALLTRERAVIAESLLDQCMAIIQTMPEHLRIAILLRGDGHTSSQIGRQMGVDSSTVRGYWQQAIKALTAGVGDVIEILDNGMGQRNDDEKEAA